MAVVGTTKCDECFGLETHGMYTYLLLREVYFVCPLLRVVSYVSDQKKLGD